MILSFNMSTLQHQSSVDLLEEVTNSKETDPDESSLLDSALGVGEEENGDQDGDGDVDGEISLLDQDESKEGVQIEDPVHMIAL